jgi:serine/threonine protein kinase
VAIKVDRIRRGQKKQAIQHADVAMQIGRDLSTAPHVIRLYDAGKLKGRRYTYHVLQLVDGDTLDNLIGVTGVEHSSILRPDRQPRSEGEVQELFKRAMRGSHGEGWRRRRLARPFTDPLTLSQMLDLLTSKLLWVEEVHQLGYAVNDLKNGNLMVSRRGQLKGIDLDSYSPIQSSTDRIMDFSFLAVSTSLFLLNVTDTQRQQTKIVEEGLLNDQGALRAAIEASWHFGDVGQLSKQYVTNDDVIEFLLALITRCRDHSYVEQADRYTEDIDRLIRLKRSIFAEELVLD